MHVRILLIIAMLFASARIWSQDFGDTPYVQTPQNVVDAMLETARVKRDDYVIDLGSGDGRMVITAAKKHGAQGFGVDLDRRLVNLANINARKAGVAERAKFYAQDLFETDLSRASVVTLYLLPEVNIMASSKLLALRPGTRIVSHDYGIGDWTPDSEYEIDAPNKPVGRSKMSKVLYWIVPDHVAGRWMWLLTRSTVTHQVTMLIQQNYQKLDVKAELDGNPVQVEQAQLIGKQLSFKLTLSTGEQFVYSGERVNNAFEGSQTQSGQDAKPWSAVRVEMAVPMHVLKPMESPREPGVNF